MAMLRLISTHESGAMKRQYSVPHRRRGAVQANLAVLAFFSIAFFLLTERPPVRCAALTA